MMDPKLVVTILIAFAVFWELLWKAIACWRAAKRNQTAWYLVLLTLNTMGILPIIYLAFYSGLKMKKPFKRKK